MIRVLHVVNNMNRGGAETMIMNIYRKIDKSKIQFDFVVHSPQKGDYEEEIKSLGGKIIRIESLTVFNFFTYYKQWSQIFHSEPRYKIVHGHLGSTAAIYLLIAKKFGCFTIAHSHNTNSREKSLKSILYKILSYPTRYIGQYFFACGIKAGRDRYGKKICESNKFKVLNNAIDTKKFLFNKEERKKIRKDLNCENKFVIGHIGRFNTQKNHKFLIDIFNEVVKCEENTVLLLIGNGILFNDIQEKVKKLNLKEKVIFMGVRNDIEQLLNAMDLVVFPSLYEGLPLTIIESQANGLKHILSSEITTEVDITGNIEYLSLNDCSNVWRDKILEYKNNYERLNMFQKIYNANYDIKSTVKELQSFYLNI